MSRYFRPFDPDQPLMARCGCGRDHTVGEHAREAQAAPAPERDTEGFSREFIEATLVKALEEKGIGRPSTYASIMSVIQDREYVQKLENKFHPTELGTIVNDLLIESFTDLFAVEYTAQMEAQLDEVEDGKLRWTQALHGFYDKFTVDLKSAQEHMRDPREIVVKSRGEAAPKIRQRYWFVSGLHKLDALTRLLEAENFDAVLVFVRTKIETVELANRLEARGLERRAASSPRQAARVSDRGASGARHRQGDGHTRLRQGRDRSGRKGDRLFVLRRTDSTAGQRAWRHGGSRDG